MTNANERFFLAVRNGDEEAVARALEKDPALIHATSAYGLRPLLEAGLAGQKGLVALLLECDAPVDLDDAAALGRLDLLEAALAATPDALDATGQGGWTPLHLAAFAGEIGTTRRLLEAGAQTSVISENGERNSPLHAALAGNGDPQVVRILLEAGARPDARASKGVTPLHLAASRGDLETITLLMEAGARPEAMEDGRTPADLARERGHPEVAEQLMPGKSAPTRRTFLAVAAIGGAMALSSLPETLVGEMRQEQERPPALSDAVVREFVVAAHSDLELTRSLLQTNPALLNATWDWGAGDFETALGGASHMGRRDIAALLLGEGARLDLFCAAMMDMADVVSAVLELYPDAVTWKGPHGISLLRHAEAGEASRVIALLS